MIRTQVYLLLELKDRCLTNFIPPAGKRKCLGENVARTTIFLFLANLLRSFDFSVDTNVANVGVGEKPLPTLLPEGGLTIGPQKFFAKVSPRS